MRRDRTVARSHSSKIRGGGLLTFIKDTPSIVIESPPVINIEENDITEVLLSKIKWKGEYLVFANIYVPPVYTGSLKESLERIHFQLKVSLTLFWKVLQIVIISLLVIQMHIIPYGVMQPVTITERVFLILLSTLCPPVFISLTPGNPHFLVKKINEHCPVVGDLT
jgi:hypothetical protein